MYTDPNIVHDDSCRNRSYVKILVNGVRYRFYNGREINLHCFPNHTANGPDRMRLLKQLQYELKKQLERGWRPGQKKQKEVAPSITLQQGIELIINSAGDEQISDRYRTEMIRVGEKLIVYIRLHKVDRLLLTGVKPQLIESFLQAYSSSGSYYMTQRSNLAGIFTRLVRKGLMAENPVYKTGLKRKVPTLNVIFQKEQMRGVLDYLRVYDCNLYLCALMMYGCFLRPHREIRLLRRKHLNEDCTRISLSGTENKSKRIRVIRLPKYVTDELMNREIHRLAPEHYLLTRKEEVYNGDYFKTLWTRAKRELLKMGLLTVQHTLYSFRHTGAVEVYQKTKDPYKVQQAMFHSSLTVTLVYLRSLGLLVDNNLDDLPDL